MGETVQLSKGEPAFIRSGEVIAGKYRLERELGRGAMGTVWAARHLTLGQRVAIKLIAAEHAQSPEARIRFSTEAKAAARLKSRHVVQVYDNGETSEGTPYIVMEYLEGETLEARLDREREIPLVDAVRITAQVARALARAHAQGVVHRDLKPGNIFLARNDEDELGWTAKVLDFGIAKLDEPTTLSTTKTGAVLGTPLFMSPEQVRGASRVDSRSDLYSLGICFYNMLTGHFAFDGESFGDILVAICTEPLPDLRARAPAVSQAVADWFARCCARLPEDRFQSSDELVEGLRSAVGGSVVLIQRGLVPEELRGPSGTLRGHSAPLSTRTPAVGSDDSGAFIVRQATGSDARGALAELGRGDTANSVLSVHDANLAKPSRSRRVALVALASACALGLLGLGFGLRSSTTSELPPSAAVRATPLAARSSSPLALTKPERRPDPATGAKEQELQRQALPAPSSTPAKTARVASPPPTPAGPRSNASRPTRAGQTRKKAVPADLGF
jgi:serine/threonine-protein kinase